ncbi:PucR family transcriptional regulator [Streptomyces mauvecolor]
MQADDEGTRSMSSAQRGAADLLDEHLPLIVEELAGLIQAELPRPSAHPGDASDAKIRSVVERAVARVIDGARAASKGGVPPQGGPTAARQPQRHGVGAGPATVRGTLAEALVSARAVPDARLDDLAGLAGWPLPDRIQAVALPVHQGAPPPALHGVDVLVGWDSGAPYLLIPDPQKSTRARLHASLQGLSAVVGPVVLRNEVGVSLRWARTLLTVTPRAGAGAEAQPVYVEDQLPTLILLQNESLTRLLARRWLRPLNELTPRQKDRIAETLLAWLEGGSSAEAARRLRVHPQTIRYRMRQIEVLFGEALHDPQSRFELELALRSRELWAVRARRRRNVPKRRE